MGRFYILLVVVLLPAAAAGQKAPLRPDSVAQPRLGAYPTVDQARVAAVALTREGIRLSRIRVWRLGAGLAPNVTWHPAGELSAARGDAAVWDDVFVIAVTAAGTEGHARVVIDRKTGQVLRLVAGPWLWRHAPAWWVRGSPAPPGK